MTCDGHVLVWQVSLHDPSDQEAKYKMLGQAAEHVESSCNEGLCFVKLRHSGSKNTKKNTVLQVTKLKAGHIE